MHKKSKLILYAAITFTLIFIILISDFIVPYDPYEQNLQMSLSPPSDEHILGTDKLGRDIFSRLLVGGRVTIFSAVAVIFITTTFGTLVGIIAGYFGGVIDNILMRISDVFLSFPGIVLAIAVAGILGGGIANSVIAISLITWPKFARLARAETFRVKSMPYIDVAKMNNINAFKIILKHILPNVRSLILTTAVVDIAAVMMEIAALSFIGLGAAPPTAEWGAMMNDGISLIQTSPWVILAPAIAIFITVTVFNLLGESVREYLK